MPSRWRVSRWNIFRPRWPTKMWLGAGCQVQFLSRLHGLLTELGGGVPREGADWTGPEAEAAAEAAREYEAERDAEIEREKESRRRRPSDARAATKDPGTRRRGATVSSGVVPEITGKPRRRQSSASEGPGKTKVGAAYTVNVLGSARVCRRRRVFLRVRGVNETAGEGRACRGREIEINVLYSRGDLKLITWWDKNTFWCCQGHICVFATTFALSDWPTLW